MTRWERIYRFVAKFYLSTYEPTRHSSIFLYYTHFLLRNPGKESLALRVKLCLGFSLVVIFYYFVSYLGNVQNHWVRFVLGDISVLKPNEGESRLVERSIQLFISFTLAIMITANMYILTNFSNPTLRTTVFFCTQSSNATQYLQLEASTLNLLRTLSQMTKFKRSHFVQLADKFYFLILFIHGKLCLSNCFAQ